MMNANHQPDAYGERLNRLLDCFLEIMPELTAMSPDLRAHLMKVEPARFPPSLIVGPANMHRLATMLHGDPRPTVSELSRALSIPLSSASRIVSILERQGFARKERDTEDGRVIRVGLTDSGCRIYEAMLGYGINNARRMLDCLTEEEQIILLTLLGKVAANLKRRR